MPGEPRREVGGIAYAVMPLREAIAWVAQPHGGPRAVHFAPAYTVALAQRDPEYRSILNRADAVFSDGMPVVWAGRRLHPEVADAWERVYGPDVMEGVLGASEPGVQRHYLLGATPTTLAALREAIGARFPGATVAGSESPPFRAPTAAELRERDARIADAGATHVWVGLGTPKQDHEVRRLADALPLTALAVGAAFDFIAGTVPQAPRWMQRSGLEWAFRLSREPRRLAGRYLWGNPVFAAAVAKQAIAERKRGGTGR